MRLSSPRSVYKNILMTQGGPGLVKAWDTVTGELRWTLNLKAQPGDPNAATWLNDSLNSRYTPGLWGIFTVDVERGLLFVPVEKVGNDYYGGPHHGNNLYSDSLLAVDVNTGKIKWYQQLVHHDIWDYDLAAQPTLVDVAAERASRSGRGADHEDGDPVRLQSRDRRADVRHGGAAGAADHRAGRMDLADAAVSR